MTNSAVIKLVRAGFKDKTVIAIINSRPNHFDLEPDRLIELKRSGVSENIMLAMLSQSDALFAGDDLVLQIPTTRASDRPRIAAPIFLAIAPEQVVKPGKGNERFKPGRSYDHGQRYSSHPEATTDENGASLKLEKTPTLNNESIIRLVEAGFSEGTIIKRIEGSPVDFDLSDVKIDELRRHRVTEPVVASMKTAMRDESDQTSPSQTRSN